MAIEHSKGDYMRAEHMQKMFDAEKLLQAAVDLHKRHMDGTEPTSVESQKKLMALLEGALEKLKMK